MAWSRSATSATASGLFRTTMELPVSKNSTVPVPPNVVQLFGRTKQVTSLMSLSAPSATASRWRRGLIGPGSSPKSVIGITRSATSKVLLTVGLPGTGSAAFPGVVNTSSTAAVRTAARRVRMRDPRVFVGSKPAARTNPARPLELWGFVVCRYHPAVRDNTRTAKASKRKEEIIAGIHSSRERASQHRRRGTLRVPGVVAGVDAEVVEEEALGEAIENVLLGDFASGVVLARSRRQRGQFGERGLAGGGVFRAVCLDQFLQEVGAFEDDAAARRLGRELAEVGKKRGGKELLLERPRVGLGGMDRLG